MVKKLKKGSKIYLELPEESEVIEVKEGILLILTREKGSRKEKEKKETRVEGPAAPKESANEEEVLRKLYFTPYKERKIKSLGGKFSKEEISILKGLLEKKKLFIREKGGAKYLAFPKAVFDRLREEAKKGRSDYIGEAPSYAIATESEARKILERNGRKYVAIKHFDGKVYIADRSFLQRAAKKVKEVLKEGPMMVEEISRKAELDEKGVLVVLRLLNESAEVIELKKGLFSLTD